jgi:trypsin
MRRIFALLFSVLGLGATVLAAGPTQAIVGGSAVPANAYSFMASVQSGGSHFCGGSIIATRWVLTAAHCVPDKNPSGLTVRVGSNNNTSGGSVIGVDQVQVDNLFDGTYYDVALLHVVSDIPANLQRIALAPVGDDTHEADGTPVVVAGWGDFNPITMGLLAMPTLNETTVNVVGDANCGEGTPGSYQAETTVCAAALLKDSCQGDSGGPLFWKSGLQRIQIGVVSHGLLCAIPEFPGAYGEVNNAQMRGFINTYVPGV